MFRSTQNDKSNAASVTEMAHASENHRHVALICGGNHFVVTD
jgi:hypothetical protein